MPQRELWMSFIAANKAYENWLRNQCAVVETDLTRKHTRMEEDAFHFLRATCFRWSAQILERLPQLASAPAVLSVGDCHSEYFGTWRDGESRLVWGINDFDDAAEMPYPLDLVRLATSVHLAEKRKVSSKEAAEAILDGYLKGIEQPRPALIDELDNPDKWMREYIEVSDDKRLDFWDELEMLPAADPPPQVAEILKKSLPPHATVEKFAPRPRQGGGSLGRPRYIVVARHRGGRVVREAEALVPSSWDFSHGTASARSRLLTLAKSEYRSPDPFLKVYEQAYVVRRLWPDSRKMDLGEAPGRHLSIMLLQAMGRDIGATHAAAPKETVKGILADLSERSADWLQRAAKSAAGMVKDDHAEWRAGRKSKSNG